MVPAFSNVGTLRRLANGMQPQAARELLQIVKVVPSGSSGLEPRGLRAPNPGAEVDLDELGSGGHDEASFYQFAGCDTTVTLDPGVASASASHLATPPPRSKSVPSRER